MGFFRRLRAKVPTREQIQANRWLGWLAPWLGHTRLWHWSRRGVALGSDMVRRGEMSAAERQNLFGTAKARVQ